MTKKNSGITLVALTIIVIILLILSGITISLIAGDNGTIDNAAKAKQEAEFAQTKEDLMEKWLIMENETRRQYNTNEKTASLFAEKMQEDDEEATATYKPENNTYEVNYKGYTLAMTPEGDVIEPGSDQTPTANPSITIATQPQDKEIFVGSNTELTTSATGDGNLSYQWYSIDKNSVIGGTALKNATSNAYKINKAQKADRRYYYCEITSKANGQTETAKTTTAYVKVIEKITADAIKTNQKDVTVANNDTLSLSITADAEGALSYQWYYIDPAQAGSSTPGQAPDPATNPGTAISGATQSTYTKPNANQEDVAGYYYCVVTQTVNGETATATSDVITVNGNTLVEITKQPESVTANLGEDVSLTIEATGSGNLTYQWYKDEAPITNATNATLTIESATTANNGNYYCRITQEINGTIANTINTNTAQVTINKATPQIVLNTQQTETTFAQTTTFTATPSVTPTVNGTWSITSSNPEAIEITSGHGANANNNQPTNITYRAKSASDEAITITITFNPSDTANYNSATATYTITKINKIPATLPSQITAYTGTYDGEPHTITISQDHNGGTLVYSTSEDNGTTWSEWEEYTGNSKPTRTREGTTLVRIKVEGDSNHIDSETAQSSIHLSSSAMEVVSSNYTGTYDGQAHSIQLEVTKPVHGYTIYYSTEKVLHQGNFQQGTTTKPTRTDVGETTVYWYIDLGGNTNYSAQSGSNKITITKRSIDAQSITIELTPQSFIYNGESQKPAIRVTDTAINKELTPEIDYTVTYPEDLSNPGQKLITIKGAGNYNESTEKDITYPINKKSIAGNDITITLSETSFTYNKAPQKPAIIEVKDTSRNVTLSEGTDYTITYPENITDAGNKTITIVGNGNYSSATSKTATYNIAPKDISTATVALSPDSFVYDGTAKTPTIEVRDEATTLTNGVDYEVTITNNTQIGVAQVTINGKGNYDPNTFKTANFTINERTTANFTIELSQNTYTYDGTAKTPEVTVKEGTKTLTQNVDYEVSITNNINAGTALVTVVGKGSYDVNSTKTANFTITKVAITVTAGSASKVYDGTPLTKNEVTLTQGALIAGQTLTGTALGTIKEVGSAENKVDQVVIKDSNNQDTTNNYDITKQSGTLVVTGATTRINYVQPDPVVVGNNATLTCNASPAVEGKWTIQAGSEVEVKIGNYSTGSATTFTYQGVTPGSTDIVINFTPTNESYSPSTVVFTQEVQHANYQVNTTYYSSLASAYASGGSTITVLRSCEDSSNVEINSNVTLALGSHKITRGTGTISVTSGTVNINANDDGEINGSAESIIDLRGGTVNVNGGSLVNVPSSAIALNGGTINVGNAQDAISESIPNISGGSYGINKTSGTFNFYNGTVQGSTQACNELANTTRPGYIYDTTTEDGINLSFLTVPANPPVLTQGMIPIKYNDQNGSWIICSTSDPEWYSYTARERKWANIMLSDGTYNTSTPIGTEVAEDDLGSMFVWVPRYAYSIERGYHTSDSLTVPQTNATKQKIRVQYLVGTTNTDIEGTSYPIDYDASNLIAGNVTPMIVHPTFTSQTNQLSGIWIAKFEASGTNSSGRAVGNNTNGGDTVEPIDETTIVKSLPTKISWRNLAIGAIQYQSTQMSAKTNYGWAQNTVDTHLIKNTEWGATAYLTYSRYGTVPMKNGCGIGGNVNYDLYTGMGPTTDTSNSGTYTPSAINSHKYNTNNGQLASTTGNTYGIYDMSGGSWEYVAAYLDTGNVNLNTYGNATGNNNIKYFEQINNDWKLKPQYSSLWEKIEEADEIKNNNISIKNNDGTTTNITKETLWNTIFTNVNNNKPYNIARQRIADEIVKKLTKGIGMNETSDGCSYFGVTSNGSYDWMYGTNYQSVSTKNGWTGDLHTMGKYDRMFIYRGGRFASSSGGGILTLYWYNGNSIVYNGFRPSIVPENPALDEPDYNTSIDLAPTSGVIVLGNGNLTAQVTATGTPGALAVATSNAEIATAQVSEVVNNRATLTIEPHQAGTASITVTEPTRSQTVTYTVIVQEANYQVASTYYNTLGSAVEDASQGSTIQVLKSNTDTSNVNIAKTVNLDLGGNTIIRGSNPINVATNGTLTIYNGEISSSGESAITVAGGTLNYGRQSDAFADGNLTENCDIFVSGAGYGINRTSGTWNFYNGRIQGTSEGANYEPANVRTGFVFDARQTTSYTFDAFLTPKANQPMLTTGMIPIKYKESSGNWVICSATDPEWYSYTARKKQWANIMLSDGRYNSSTPIGTEVAEADLGSMFVWVPRYAYSIVNGYQGKDSEGNDVSTMTEEVWQTNANPTKNIDIRFLVDDTNSDILGNTFNTDYDASVLNPGDVTPMIVHPTFTTQSNQFTNENTQLNGIWIAKFEASGTNAQGRAVGNYTNGDATVEPTDGTTIVKSLPSKISWRHIQIGDMQYQSTQMSTKTNYGWTQNTVDTHLIKDSEWGATAYLTYSRYGTVPMINGCGTNSTRWYDLYTGMGPASSTSESRYNATSRNGHEYNTSNGQLASTTGNTYGIYDMSGGSWEYVATYLDNRYSYIGTYGNSSNATYFNRTGTTTDNQAEYELNSTYASLWEKYDVSNEERNNTISVEGVGTLTKKQLWDASGSSYTNMTTNIKYNTARKRLTDATYNLMQVHKGIGVNEVAGSHSFYGVASSGNYTWMLTESTSGYGRAWNTDHVIIGNIDRAFVGRGGHATYSAGAGVLHSYPEAGRSYSTYSFRPALTLTSDSASNITVAPSSGTVVLGAGNLEAVVTVGAESGALSVSSSDNTIATASISAVNGSTATLTIEPHQAGSAVITITEANAGKRATFTANVQSANYSVAGNYYNTLATAVASASSGDTVTVLQDCIDESTTSITKNITLELGSHTITRNNGAISIANGGTLNINGTTGTIIGTSTYTIGVTGGTLNVNGGKIVGNNNYAINQTGGTINIGRGEDTFVDVDDTNANLVIDGGSYGIYSTGGTWNLYNGYVAGTTAGSNTDASNVRNGYTYDTESYGEEAHSFLTANANAPVLVQGMIPIKYTGNETTGKWTICSTTDPEWYSYTARGQKWANIMLSDGRYKANGSGDSSATVGTEVAEADLGSMFVWVPRYAYSIVHGYQGKDADGVTDVATMTQSPTETNIGAQNIKVQYLVGTTNTDVEGNTYGTDYDMNSVNPGGVTPMITHPTFTTQTNFISGNPTQLPGIWVAKFEASGTNASGNAVGNYTNGEETVEPTDGTTIVKSLPSKISWRHIKIGDMQYQSTQMSSKTDYGWSANTVDTHLIKNSEWGATSYLTYSRYGTVPMINGCGTTSPRWYDLYTGMGPASSASESKYIATSRNGHEYNTSNGKLASTTGNTYGIYDMSGGSWEYTATFLDNKHNYLSTYGNNTNVTYFNRTGTTTDNQAEYELNPTYESLWEKYQVSDEERNNSITVTGESNPLTKKQLWDKNGTSFTDMAVNVRYNTARKRITDATYNLMQVHKGIGQNEVAGSHPFYGVGENGAYQWKTKADDKASVYGRAWNNDYVQIGHAALPFVNRGGIVDNGAGAGVLYSSAGSGYGNHYYGFRPAILPEETASTNINITPSSGTVVLGNGNLSATVYVTAQAGALSVSSSDETIATASLTGVSNGQATLTVVPHQAGTARITVTEAGGGSATYTANIQQANYSVAGRYYNTLASAYAVAPNNGTIEVLQDAIDESTVAISKNITLELGEHTITRNNGTIHVSSNGTLTINSQSGTIISTSSNTINVASGTLNVNGGKIVGNSNYAINQTGGTINIGRGEDSFIDVDDSDASLVIDGGSYGIYSTGGTWNLYNGYVAGTTAGSNTDASNVRNGYIFDAESYGDEAHGFLTAKANAPVLTQGMIPIKYTGDETTGKWTICSTTDPEWYSYTARGQKWANIMLSDGRYKANGSGDSSATVGTEVAEADLGSMFVWVPRYAYSIVRGYQGKDSDGVTEISTMNQTPAQTNAGAQNIKVQYLVGTTNTDIEGNTYGTDYDMDSVNPGGVTPMITHPTFTTQTNFISGNPTQLPGIWVAKFEASGTNSSGNAVGNYTNGDETVEPTDGTTIVKSLPSKISWRNIKIGDMQYRSTQMSANTTYGWSANTVDTHLIKNSEWGSTSYLSYSRYGTVPMKNSCGNGTPRAHDLYTGMGPTSSSSEVSRYNASARNGHEYNTSNGQLASTTGNTYGIYDMSGGSWEYVAEFLDNKHSHLGIYGNSSSVTYFNRTGTTTDNQAEYELNPSYSALWEKYQVSDEERNNTISVEGVGTLTKKQLYDANGSSYTNMTTNIKYNTARKRLVDATYNLMQVHKGIGVNEVAGSHSFYGVTSSGNYSWMLTTSTTGMGRAWNNNNVLIGSTSMPFVHLGSSCNDSTKGLFTSYFNSGVGMVHCTFRPSILPEETASTNINITPSSGTVVLGNGNLSATVYVTAQAGALSVSSSDDTIATASLTGVSNGQATLTVTPHQAGTARITVTEAGGGTAAYTATIQQANYKVGNTYYNTLGTAVVSARSGDTITLLQDCTDTSSAYVNKNVTLDLGSYTVSRGAGQIAVADGGTLTINSASTGKISSSGINSIMVNGGTLNLNSGTIENTSGDGVYVASGTANIGQNDGTVNNQDPAIIAQGYGVNKALSGTGTWNFYNGKITGNARAFNATCAQSRDGNSIVTGTSGNKQIAMLSMWDGSSMDCPEFAVIDGKVHWFVYTPSQFNFLQEFVNNANALTSVQTDLVTEAGYDPAIAGITDGVTNVFLMNDIDLGARPGEGETEEEKWETAANEAVEWTPIGVDKNNDKIFKGIFNGQEHTITGVYVNNNDRDFGYGLFGYSKTIQNITIENSYVKGVGSTGAIVGDLREGDITNCHNKNTTVKNFGNTTGSLGGVVGAVRAGNVVNCSNTGLVESKNEYYINYTGGVVGNFYALNCTLTGCTNEGKIITLGAVVGGVCGDTYPDGGQIISNCNNSGEIVGGSTHVGGIVAQLRSSNNSVTGCHNTGKVSGTESVGGIVGLAVSPISECSNSGQVSGTLYVGGIAGHAGSTISVCSNTGNVSGPKNVGGIAGGSTSTTSDCSNAGQISGGESIGGIAGVVATIVTRCSNTGNIEGTGTRIGGIAGDGFNNYGQDISLCYNSGNVKGADNVGGISSWLGAKGASPAGKEYKCYNKGKVTITTNSASIGGVIGKVAYDASVTKCYYLSSIGVTQGIGAIDGEGDLSALNAGAQATNTDLTTYEEFLTWIESQ